MNPRLAVLYHEAFIAGAKTMCTDNIEWSIRNKRYNLGLSKCDGTAEIVI